MFYAQFFEGVHKLIDGVDHTSGLAGEVLKAADGREFDVVEFKVGF